MNPTLVILAAGIPRLVLSAALALVASVGCSTCDSGVGAASGTTPAAAAAADPPSTGPVPPSSAATAFAARLPTPPGAANVPRPAGSPGNLKVLDWAGFKSAVSYTFDDGQPSHIEHYAELQAMGVRLTFFINSANTFGQTDFVSSFSRAARDGHEIGNHTAHHCHADPDGTLYNRDSSNQRSACPGASAGAELDDCSAFITSTLGTPHVWTSASPFGDAGFNAAAARRFFLNRSATGGTVGPNDGTDPFKLPIWGPAEHDAVEKFNAAIDRAHTSGRWVIMLLHSIAPTTHQLYATVDIAAITGSVGHAKTLGDVWIDSMGNVGAYWRGQKLLSSATATISGNTWTWTWSLPDHFPPARHLRVKVDGGTLSQGGKTLTWDPHGYYDIALDAGALTLSP